MNTTQSLLLASQVQTPEEILKDLQIQFNQAKELHLGYPANLDFDYTPLLPFLNFHLNNAGDPFVLGNYQMNCKEIEQQCIEWFAQLYKLDNYWGCVTNGGTESNIQALLLGREKYPDSVMYFSRDTHYSVKKASWLLKIPHVVIESLHNGEINYQHLAAELRKNQAKSAIININLGTTMKGAIDKIEEIVKIVEKLKITAYLHCDAALSGMIIPFIPGAPKISFLDYPIDSIAVSVHKFIGSPVPSGVLLTRQDNIKQIGSNVECICSKDTTITGSRSGFNVLLLWYALKTRSQVFAREVDYCLANATYLYEGLKKLGYRPFLNQYSTIVTFDRPSPAICNKWQLSSEGNIAHIVVMQNISSTKIDMFLEDLHEENINKFIAN